MTETEKPIRQQPKQRELLDMFRAEGRNVPTWIGFGGARGGAKSKGIRDVMVIRRFEMPNTPGFIIRRNYPDLYENHIIKFQIEYPELSQFYNVQHKEYTLPNGSRIAFKAADTMKEIQQISRGPEAVDIMVDQAEQFSGEELLMLHSPNRWPSARPGVCKTGLFFNPGGIGTEYLRRIFWQRDYHGDENPEDYRFIHAFGWDNFEWFRNEVGIAEDWQFYQIPGMCERCEREKDKRPDGITRCCRFQMFICETSEGRKYWGYPPSLRLGELFGSFQEFAGQYYAGVWDESRVVIPCDKAERLIQPWWVRWMSTDWGFAHYAAHHWFATGKVGPQELQDVLGINSGVPLDVVIVYRELVVNETPEVDLAAEIVRLTPYGEKRMISRHFLSPETFGKRDNSTKDLIEEVMRLGGLPNLEPADDARIDGWRTLYDGFRRTCAWRGSLPAQDFTGPLLLISGNCPQTIASVPMLIRDPKKLEDVMKMTTLADDVGDCLRYGYKSMLDPHSQAPREVRAKELYNSIQGEDADAMTARAMAMLQFQVKNPPQQRLGRQRWRQ